MNLSTIQFFNPLAVPSGSEKKKILKWFLLFQRIIANNCYKIFCCCSVSRFINNDLDLNRFQYYNFPVFTYISRYILIIAVVLILMLGTVLIRDKSEIPFQMKAKSYINTKKRLTKLSHTLRVLYHVLIFLTPPFQEINLSYNCPEIVIFQG